MRGATAQMPDVLMIQNDLGDWNGNPVPDILRWAVRSILEAPKTFPQLDTSRVLFVYQQEWLALARELGFPPTKVQQWIHDDATLRLIVETYCASAAVRVQQLAPVQD
jgi:hypothetical protein